MGKRELRAAARMRRVGMAAKEVVEHSARVCAQVVGLPEFAAAGVVYAYAALRNEVDTGALVEAAWAAGKVVCFPRTEGARLVWGCVREASQLVPGARGILEPYAGADAPPAATATDLCLVPGVLFHADGHRVGQGGGHYDRFLATFPGVQLGLAYQWQLHGDIVPEAHDVPVQIIVTEQGVLRVPQARG